MAKVAKKKAKMSALHRKVAAVQEKPAKSLWASLKPGPANFTPLSPLSFLPRAAEIFPDRVAVVHGKQRITYAGFYERARRLASALHKRAGRTAPPLCPTRLAVARGGFRRHA